MKRLLQFSLGQPADQLIAAVLGRPEPVESDYLPLEEQERAENEKRQNKEYHLEEVQLKFADAAKAVGVPRDDADRFFERFKALQPELEAKLGAMEKELTGSPEERRQQMEALAQTSGFLLRFLRGLPIASYGQPGPTTWRQPRQPITSVDGIVGYSSNGWERPTDQAGRVRSDVPKVPSEAAPEAEPGKRSIKRGAKRNPQDLDPAERDQVTKLQARDRAVRSHEAAHLAAAGGLASGGASFSYEQGPDGRRYAVGGEVQLKPAGGRTPEESLALARQIRSAALAPADPSSADLSAAANAALMEQEALAELQAQAAAASTAGAGRFQVYTRTQSGRPAESAGFAAVA